MDNGVPVRDIAEIVGRPILGHRVVTLSREVHAMLLATDSVQDVAELNSMALKPIDLVYVTLYPLQEEVSKSSATLQSVIENTDIGGPTILRSAAKGRRIVVSNEDQFLPVLDAIRNQQKADPEEWERFISFLAACAETTVAKYASASAAFHSRFSRSATPSSFSFIGGE